MAAAEAESEDEEEERVESDRGRDLGFSGWRDWDGASRLKWNMELCEGAGARGRSEKQTRVRPKTYAGVGR